MKKPYIVFVVIVVVLIAIVVIGLSKSNNKASLLQVKIGAVIPLTGTGAYWGEPVQRGIALAQDAIDARSGTGTVSIIVEDGKSDPTASVSAAQKLLSVDGAGAIYTEFSGPSSAEAPVVKAAGKVYYYGAFNPKVVAQFDNSIKGFLSFTDPCDSFGKYMQAKGIKKVAILNQFADVSPSCVTALDKYMPEKDILVFDNLPKDNDYRGILLQIKSFGAGAIIGMTYEGPALAWIKQMDDLKLNIPVFSGLEDALTQKVIGTIGAKNLEGSMYFAAKVDPAFTSAYQIKYPASALSDLEPAAYVYEAMLNLSGAMLQCKSDVACVTASFGDKPSDAGAIVDAHFKDRILYSSLDYYLIHSGTTTPFTLD